MRSITVETYEKGTGKLLSTETIDVADRALSSLGQLVALLVERGVITELEGSLLYLEGGSNERSSC